MIKHSDPRRLGLGKDLLAYKSRSQSLLYHMPLLPCCLKTSYKQWGHTEALWLQAEISLLVLNCFSKAFCHRMESEHRVPQISPAAIPMSLRSLGSLNLGQFLRISLYLMICIVFKYYLHFVAYTCDPRAEEVETKGLWV